MRVPANLVTGFLGAGKTTAIRQLLAHRPARERWAVLVNEFGELGIDGAVLAADGGVAVREVAGGCVCCTGNVPMRVALTQLLRVARPQRLLVEPTGLGHAAGVFGALEGDGLAPHLEPAAVLCVVDPRQAADPRIAASGAFRDQLALADVVVINKRDIATPAELAAARRLAASLSPACVVVETERSALDPVLLALPHAGRAGTGTGHAAPERSWSVRFPPEAVFDRARLGTLFVGLNAPGGTRVPGLLRAKGVFRVGREAVLADWAGGQSELREAPCGRDSRATFVAAADADPDWGEVAAALDAAALPGEQAERAEEELGVGLRRGVLARDDGELI
ncbi:MAG: GTP-binding protein [Burkholderiales bacterium]|nr:GTP-binding protein [Burkholderiales bacterium]